MKLKIKRVRPNVALPEYKTDGSSGFDLEVVERVSLHDGVTVKLPTGLAFEIPPGYELQIRPRSSASSRDIDVKLGTVDSDFRGEVWVVARSTRGLKALERGERIAQAVLCPVARAELVEVDELSDTARGDGGFGSTGGRYAHR